MRPKFLIKQLLIKEGLFHWVHKNISKPCAWTYRLWRSFHASFIYSLEGVYIPFSGLGRQDLALIVTSSIYKMRFICEFFYPRYRQMGLGNSRQNTPTQHFVWLNHVKNRRLFSIVLPFHIHFIVLFWGCITKTKKLLCVTDNRSDVLGGGGYYHCGQPRRGGVWKSPFLADVLCEWPLRLDLQKAKSSIVCCM